ncbi:conserved hypothetical protein [Vibrio phage 511E55-1]|nr:conserved hypothetical protein [Vibrio phage 511E55-1]
MTIEINEKDVNRALRVARMVAKCDCQEKGGSIDNHFATIICDNHDRMAGEIAELKGESIKLTTTMYQLRDYLSDIEYDLDQADSVFTLKDEIALIDETLSYTQGADNE